MQPLRIEPFDETISNAMGGAVQLQGQTAFFAVADVIALRKLDKDGEFKITIVGNGTSERTFQVKKKHFSRLP